METLFLDAIALLKQLIAIPSFSKEEDKTGTVIEQFFIDKKIPAQRYLNNVWAINRYFDPLKPTVVLNSHHDTVKPNPKYTKDPFTPIEEDGKLFGLGSNDAGGCLVSLISTFVHFYDKENLSFNVVIAATAEEEITGKNGIEALLVHDKFSASLHNPDFKNNQNQWFAIVGEPTKMQLAIAEKGLMVLDAVANGKAGHAARNEGESALYKAMQDIAWFSTYKYPKVSQWLGEVKQTVTVIETENKAHNVIPATCNFVVDLRLPDCYTHEEVMDIIREHIQSDFKERSIRLRSSRIEVEHPLVKAGIALGNKPYGSPTCSDKALMPFPALKCGPGDSARSHTADEFIFVDEIKGGIETYIKMLEIMGENL
ncbi:M20 family metallo-hydrolase [Arachidicoccus sp.]|uniref:M20 family metallo-hydrolase n=1 Tax=Arachidicoccus sp. TaxID=1872624 RepID=UPI003D24E1CA